jgi:hypothetical protein
LIRNSSQPSPFHHDPLKVRVSIARGVYTFGIEVTKLRAASREG